MLVTNFTLSVGRTERANLRLRLSNLEGVSLAYAVDFVVRKNEPTIAPLLNAGRDDPMFSALDLAGLLGLPHWADEPWRLSGDLWIKTVRITLAPGTTDSIWLNPWTRGEAPPFARLDEGYVILRLPPRRDPRNLLRRLPQLDRPARALLAAEAVLRQLEWPPSDQRIQGYGPGPTILDRGPPIYGPATRPFSEIVHPLALATGRAEIELVPEGANVLERIEVERTGARLVERLERGEAVRGADGFDATDRLAAFVDEIALLGTDPNALGAMNAFLARQGSTVQLAPAADPNQPRRRRPRRNR